MEQNYYYDPKTLDECKRSELLETLPGGFKCCKDYSCLSNTGYYRIINGQFNPGPVIGFESEENTGRCLLAYMSYEEAQKIIGELEQKSETVKI